ncbi:DUF222 domain-containing protein [Arthrobacter sp. NPDC093139]|uniref:HNH endonuclease signature motif containing protein n=1 Tax=Arthrobacter sp. NPDC093139 TaxID=3363945 RepID=UPI003815F145
MDDRAVVESLEGIEASVAALAVVVRRGTGEVDGDVTGGVALATAAPLLHQDPLRGTADACLDGLAEVGRMEAQLAALKVHFAAGYAAAAEALAGPASSPQERTAQEIAVTAEVACVLTVSERSAAALLGDARTLTTARPLTLSTLSSGSISWQHARILCDETANLEPAAATALETHFLEACVPEQSDPEWSDVDAVRLGAARRGPGCLAGELVPGRFRARARAWRERHHPVSIETRHRRSVKDRRVEYVPDRDGMAWLSAYLPADTAAGIWNRSTDAARALKGPAESRTLMQLRADVAAGWLLYGEAKSVAGGLAEGILSPSAQVLVTVPVFSLLDAGEEPAVLDGYGPVPASIARRLVADGATSFLRVLTDPRDGAPLEIGRTSYRLTKPMRQWLRLRDGKCPFPGCNNQSLDNEADHLLAWSEGGGTGIANLGQPCPKHHRLKHTTLWRPVNATRDSPPGWISQAGRHYPSEQQDWEPPHLPNYLERLDHLDWPDGLEEPDNEGLDPPLLGVPLRADPLPVDPFPDWTQFTAA